MSILEQVYDPEEFRRLGHSLIDMLADHLSLNRSGGRDKVIDYVDPDRNLADWDQANPEPLEYFRKLIQNSMHLHHPRYIGHQVCPPAPLAALAAMEGMFINSGGAIYEMSQASSTLERLVIDRLKPYFGFSDGDGIITSGGTLANLTALICARNVRAGENVWQNGQEMQYAFMVSEEAHYCIDRAVRIMGWGDKGIIKVPVDDNYCIRTDLLAVYYQEAMAKGIEVLGVVGSAPTTSTGKYDDLQALGRFAADHGLWYHIDAAHGGPAVFSEKYRHLMEGCQLADSITVDAHKMMMVPSLTTMLFFRESRNSYKTFAQQADYLWNASAEEWYNYGKRTMECTKIMLSTRIYALMQHYGIDVFGRNIDTCYGLAATFAEKVKTNPGMSLAVMPDSNIVCFRLNGYPGAYANDLNRKVRQAMLEEGRFYIVQTVLRGDVWLRISIMNPMTTSDDLQALIDHITDVAKRIY